jgi:hypothetical protein
MKKLKLALITLTIACAPAAGFAAPPLDATSLYKDLARGCRTLDLQHWTHPTRHVLEHAEIAIKKVELCNHDVYPVFTVVLKYDPNGPNDKYYNKLYVDMMAANAYHSFALVDTDLGWITEVTVKDKHDLNIDYEEFSPQAKP